MILAVVEIMFQSLYQRLWGASRARRIHQLLLAVFVGQLTLLPRNAKSLLLLFTSGTGTWQDITWMEFYYYGFDYLALCGILAIIGILLVSVADYIAQRADHKPMKELLQCVEAAAAGDLSRVPPTKSFGEVGQLARAVGRLMDVVSRSENRIYHL